jgi:hypothetical protein
MTRTWRRSYARLHRTQLDPPKATPSHRFLTCNIHENTTDSSLPAPWIEKHKPDEAASNIYYLPVQPIDLKWPELYGYNMAI